MAYRSLNSICRARDEARYISRTWSNQPTAPDVPWEPVYEVPVESLDDIILVCRPDPTTISGERGVEMTRRQYEENKAQYQEELRVLRGASK
jgi:hypothetical protein